MRKHPQLCLLIAFVFIFTQTLCSASIVSDVKKQSATPHNRVPDLPEGIIRGPLMHEHSFDTPLITDWWEEGIPHFMIGGSAVANEKFIRLTTNSRGDHGFAFNTAPCDHPSWEVRLRFSIRPPLPIVRRRALDAAKGNNNNNNNNNNDKEPEAEDSLNYEGGEGMALWYLEQPIGDDHQHVPKYSKPIDPDMAQDELFWNDPAEFADLILHSEDDEDEDEDDEEEKGKGKGEKGEKGGEDTREERQVKQLLRQQEREDRYRKIFRRGTSTDDSHLEPRAFGLKFSELKGFGILLDSIGHNESVNGKKPHEAPKPRITVLLNLPPKGNNTEKPAVNNFNTKQTNFRTSPVRLQCDYDFRQMPSDRAIHMHKDTDPAHAKERDSLLHRTPEEPVELIVRYHRRRLTVIVTREDLRRRRLVAVEQMQRKDNGNGAPGQTHRIEKTFVDTLCGELDNVDLPQKYHFGISASTGPKPVKRRTHKMDGSRSSFLTVFDKEENQADDWHVDVHDVFSFELRELGKDAKSMGYSKSIPIEHFDYEADKRERAHFSRQLPVEPEPE